MTVEEFQQITDENAWMYNLHTGDEITWNDPDGGICSRTLVIQTIEYCSSNIIRITDKDGGELECFITELS